MPLKKDFHDLLEVFVYTNLNVIIQDIASPGTGSFPLPPGFTPEEIRALQTSALNNFNELGLKPDIDEITQIFFATLPPTETVASGTTATQTTTPTTVVP